MYTLIIIVYVIWSLIITYRTYNYDLSSYYRKDAKRSFVYGFTIVPLVLLITVLLIAFAGVALIVLTLIIQGAVWIYQNMP